MTELCHHLVESITKRFQNITGIFALMKNCLNISQLHHKVLSTNQQTMTDYGTFELQRLIDYTVSSSNRMMINESFLQERYLQWKQRCLDGIHDEETFKVWTTDGKIFTSEVMKSFYTNAILSDGINDFLHFYSSMILKIRSEAYVNQQHRF